MVSTVVLHLSVRLMSGTDLQHAISTDALVMFVCDCVTSKINIVISVNVNCVSVSMCFMKRFNYYASTKQRKMTVDQHGYW